MSFADDLLEQAEHLVGRDPRRPRQVNLRRAISAAYYGLFHPLCGEATAALVSGADFRALLSRAFEHTDMKKVCLPFTAGNLPKHLQAVVGATVPPDLRTVANAFVELQQARHDADYNLSATYSRVNTAQILHSARAAFEAWQRVRATPPARVFLVALLIGNRWNR
jgi:hypothetical protein